MSSWTYLMITARPITLVFRPRMATEYVPGGTGVPLLVRPVQTNSTCCILEVVVVLKTRSPVGLVTTTSTTLSSVAAEIVTSPCAGTGYNRAVGTAAIGSFTDTDGDTVISIGSSQLHSSPWVPPSLFTALPMACR